MAVSIGPGYAICGLDKGTKKKYKCSFCPFESDDIEDFAVSMCWNCVYGPEVSAESEEINVRL